MTDAPPAGAVGRIGRRRQRRDEWREPQRGRIDSERHATAADQPEAAQRADRPEDERVPRTGPCGIIPPILGMTGLCRSLPSPPIGADGAGKIGPIVFGSVPPVPVDCIVYDGGAERHAARQRQRGKRWHDAAKLRASQCAA